MPAAANPKSPLRVQLTLGINDDLYVPAPTDFGEPVVGCGLRGVRNGDEGNFGVPGCGVPELAEGFLGDYVVLVRLWIGLRCLQGQPQCRRKVMIVGLPGGSGKGSSGDGRAG